MTEILKGYVDAMASKGQGIIRHNGLVTFTPFTAPGDKIQYELIQMKKNYALGKLVQVQEPSESRIPARCPYFGTCGGCQLQHINYASQLEYKREWIEDALNKIGKLKVSVPSVTPAKQQWVYRRRVNLFLKYSKGSFKTGYFATDNTSILEVQSCPIFIDEKDPILKTTQELCSQLKCKDHFDARLTILKDGEKYLLHFNFRTLPENAYDLLSSFLEKHSFISGILASSKIKFLQFGISETTCQVAGLTFNLNTKTFIQAHPEQSENIYQEIKNLSIQLNPKEILDLYCGIGISTLLLAKQGFKTTGVESSPESIKFATANALKNGLTDTQFITADVKKVLAQLLHDQKPDFVIVNPPREGLSFQVNYILQNSKIEYLLYISCMPSTLARDLKLLCEKGFRIFSIKAFDMFPQTIHVETMVLLVR